MADSEIEIVESNKEAMTDGGMLAVKQDSLESTLWLADNIDKLIEANKKIFTSIMRSSHPGDFVAFGKGEKEKIEMGGAGCERIARDIGISFLNRVEKYETFQDDIGPGFRYIYEADAVFRGRTIRVMSVASSRTKFFGKEQGEYKSLSEVSRDDVQIAAYRGIFKEGVKAMLGLRRLNRAELEKYGVKIITPGGHDFKNKDEKAAEQEAATISIEKVSYKTNKPGEKEWTKYAIHGTEGDIFSTFDKPIAEKAKGMIGTAQTATINFTKSKYGNDITSFEINPEF